MEFAENICSAYSASAHFRICSVSEALQHDQPFGRRRFLESQMPRNGLNGLNGLCSEMTLLYCSRLKSSAKMKNGMWFRMSRYTVTYNMTMLPCISQVFFIRECKRITWQHSTTQNMIDIAFNSHSITQITSPCSYAFKIIQVPLGSSYSQQSYGYSSGPSSSRVSFLYIAYIYCIYCIYYSTASNRLQSLITIGIF